MLYADQLASRMCGDVSKASFKVRATLAGVEGSEALERSWVSEVALPSDSMARSGFAIYDQWTEQLMPGEYRLALEVSDCWGPNAGFLSAIVSVPPSEAETLGLSEIEFVARTEPYSQGESLFRKGNQLVFPNPSRRYGLLNPTLSFYFEVYGIPADVPLKLPAAYAIRSRQSDLVQYFRSTLSFLGTSTRGFVQELDVSSLPSGIYELEVCVNDTIGKRTGSSARTFEVMQADYFESRLFLTPEQAEIGGQLLFHVASPSERGQYERLPPSAKAEFLVRFWRQRDPTPETLRNEYLEQVVACFRYANEHFGWAGVEGWRSDRGRVLIQNGMPDDVDRHDSDPETVPYEIWSYARERDWQFVFADLQSNGRYVLIHSTKEGEVRNGSWRGLIRKL